MTGKYLIIGLGNPGREYRQNRHNVGFQVVDYLANRHQLEFSRIQSNAFVATGRIVDRNVILAKPQQYMNLSGGPVSSLARFYKIDLAHLLIVTDDLDLPLGTLRIRPGGRSGGQNGMRNIIERLGTDEFPRLRIGIGRPAGRSGTVSYVLQNFAGEDLEVIRIVYDRAADAIESWLLDGVTLAMSRHNAPLRSD
jgi:PTH1 family peptidyl-tRNA hydrolase